ncbi:EAL domain-containing protein [Sphingomonas oleivorans]|nr:EAL domain-containing protein [Sphingomonas oleivorans]
MDDSWSSQRRVDHGPRIETTPSRTIDPHGSTMVELMTALSMPAYLTDADGWITSYNEHAAALWGQHPAPGSTRWCGAARMMRPDGSVLPAEAGPTAQALLSGQNAAGVQCVAERPDGTRIPFLAFATPLFNDAGAISGAITAMVDLGAGGGDPAALIADERYRLVMRATNDCIWDWDLVSDRITWNEALETQLGHATQGGVTSADWWKEHIHPADEARVIQDIFAAISHGDSGRWSAEYRFRRGDGSYAEILDCGYVIVDENGCATRMVGAMMDLTDRNEAERSLRESEERYRYTIELSLQIPWSANAEGVVTEIGPRWQALTGALLSDVVGRHSLPLVHPDDRPRLDRAWGECVATGRPLDNEYRLRLYDGSYRWFRSRAAARRDEAGDIVRWYGTIEDIHDRRIAENNVRWTAHHDGLTSLPNRTAFQEQLEQAIAQAASRGTRIGLLLLDIDHFKLVNDQLGHDAGDALLRAFADRLRANLPEADLIARLGGDEFAVVLRDIRSTDDLCRVMELLTANRDGPFLYGGQARHCHASIGGATYPEHGRNADELLKSADIALYEAKSTGRQKYCLFESGMRVLLQRRASILSQARRALDDDRVRPFYQPKIDLASGRVAGLEALLRWYHPRLGLQLPGLIASAFEDHELSLALGSRMLEQVTADMRRMLDRGIDFGHVALNATAAELENGDYPDRVLQRLAALDIPPHRLEIEVTETVFLGRGADGVGRALCALSAAGIRLALDDFGTGYASLSHLKQFPIDVIKIDRSFTGALSDNAQDAAIVRAIIGLGKGFRMTTVAEGIETRWQAENLRELGCDMGQGYFFSKPLPYDVLAGFLREHSASCQRKDRDAALAEEEPTPSA